MPPPDTDFLLFMVGGVVGISLRKQSPAISSQLQAKGLGPTELFQGLDHRSSVLLGGVMRAARERAYSVGDVWSRRVRQPHERAPGAVP